MNAAIWPPSCLQPRRQRVDVAVGDVVEARRRRGEVDLVERLARGRERAERLAVEAVRGREDHVAAGPGAGELDRRLDDLGAAVGEGADLEVARRERGRAAPRAARPPPAGAAGPSTGAARPCAVISACHSSGGLWPKGSAPYCDRKSRYSRPSASNSWNPLPRTIAASSAKVSSKADRVGLKADILNPYRIEQPCLPTTMPPQSAHPSVSTRPAAS